MKEQQLIWEWTAANEVRQRTTERSQLQAGQVEIAISSIGICGTDLHILSGEAGFSNPPLPLGHELAGIVTQVGEHAGDWKVGDRVCIDPLIGCGRCPACRAGNKHHCPQGGEIGLHYAGGWQQYLIVPADNIYLVPDSVTLDEASQAETIHCCLGAVDKLHIRLGMAATVVGDGPTGLYFVQLLKAAGASPVTLIGMQSSRLALGEQLGADVIVNLSEPDGQSMPAADTQSIVIEAAGEETALRTAISLLGKGGQLLLFGLPAVPVAVDIQSIVMKELRLLGSTNDPHVWPRVLQMIESGAVRVEPLITQRYHFGELDEALSFVRNNPQQAIKVIVNLDQ
ncbi:zinc-dependent alcohol dehydrogenase [Paenibacillus chungangensis]|uniref:Zinc-binding dehydrogenase n=1 Tax=Paenibacillus chungangensis TaxID=696535 RepID=A0ABW3HNR8_9BACL